MSALPTSISSDHTRWQTTLFSGGSPAPRPGRGWDAATFDGVDDQLADSRSRLVRLSARAAYQEALHGRALLVDVRPVAQRVSTGEVAASLRPVVIERNVLEWRLDPRHEARLPEAAFDLRVVLLCQDGFASSLAADSLARIGVHRATDVIGGFTAWREAGLPVQGRPVLVD